MTILIVFAVAFSLIYLGVVRVRQRFKLPPGPRGWPIIGSLFDMPTEFEWQHWATFKDMYGPVSSLTVLGNTIIIFNTLQSCIDVLEKNSSSSSGRPKMQFAGEMIGWEKQIVLSPYNKHFRAMRKLAQSLIGTKAAASVYAELQESESRYLILRIHQGPDEFVNHLRATIGATLLRMSHGYVTREDGEDPFITLNERAAKEFYQATKPGRWLVDTLPWLKYVPSWVPGAGFKKVAEQYRKVNIDQTDVPYNFVLRSLEDKTALPSFVSTALQSGKLSDDEHYALKFCAAAMFGGGLDPVTAAASTFLLMIILHPNIQRKAHDELDKVIGAHRLPTLRDREHLPYITAIQKEVYRWGSVVPLGIPHCATKDIIYEQYYIPKGALMINNIWNIARDPEIYPDPTAFKPERFLGEKKELNPDTFVFGFGRRKCPGIEVADSTLFIMMAMCLAVFRFGNPKNAEGNENLPREEFLSGSVIHPKPYNCSIEPRSPDALELIQAVQSEREAANRIPSKI